jgi:predicted Zn-dependent protease
MHDKTAALKHFSTLEQQGTSEQRAVARYGIGLIHLKNLQYQPASEIFQQLTAKYPNQPQYIAALARTAMENHEADKADQLFAKAIQNFPSDDAIKIEYTRFLLKSAKPDQAKQILLSLSNDQKDRPFYYQTLAEIYADLHQPAESHRYMAEHYFASGETEDAILQIRLAKQERNLNYQMQAILDERLNFFLNELEEMKNKRD